MTEAELRALVREAISRHVAGTATRPSHVRPLAPPHHASHGLFVVPDGSDGEGPCLIEPAVTCNHCGYCKSYGH